MAIKSCGRKKQEGEISGMKIQNNNNSGDVVNGDKIGLDEQGVSAMLDDKQQQLLDIARLNLNKAVREENIESKKVLSYCAEIKMFLPDDFMANFYEVACGGTPKQLNKFLDNIDIEKNRKHVNEIVDFLLKGMEYSSVLPLKNLVDISLSGDEKTEYLTAIEQEAEKIKEGVYSTQVPRDVFVAYSSKDYKEVNKIVEYLEDNKITCFVALRNLRHGKGAVERYDEALKEAMHNCNCVVFLSSNNSRSLECDALKQEIPYIRDNEPNMGKIEYLLEDYNEGTSNAAKRICKSFFKNIEYCRCIDDLVDRVTAYITGFDNKSTDISEAAEKSPREKVKYCLTCGAENSESNKFCKDCGSKDFADYQGHLNEDEGLKKQKTEEDGKQREIIETQAEEPNLKSPQQPKNLINLEEGKCKSGDQEILKPWLADGYPTLKHYDDTGINIEGSILKSYNFNTEEAEIPYGVTTIDSFAFHGGHIKYFYLMLPYRYVIIPDSVIAINNNAFYGCDSLRSIFIPSSVTLIQDDAFAYCKISKEIMVDKCNPNFADQAGMLFNKSKTKLIKVPSGQCCIIIPANVTSIGNYALSDCTNLKSVTFEQDSELNTIGPFSFEHCNSLKEIVIPASVTSIGNYAFSNCINLESVTFEQGSKLISIGEGAFNYCNRLRNIKIPGSVEFIGKNAFIRSGSRDDIIIYCAANKRPGGWNKDWNVIDYYVFHKKRANVIWSHNNK